MMTRPSEPLPFLLHFGERLPDRPAASSRYDDRRCVGQVYVDGNWMDAVDARFDWQEGASKRTDIGRETTDDD